MFFKKKKHPKCFCNTSVLMQAMAETIAIDAGIVDIIFSYQGKEHSVGMSSDYTHRKGFFDTEFYLDNQIFTNFEAFQAEATLNGILFAEISDTVEVLTADDMPPHNYRIFEAYLVAE